MMCRYTDTEEKPPNNVLDFFWKNLSKHIHIFLHEDPTHGAVNIDRARRGEQWQIGRRLGSAITARIAGVAGDGLSLDPSCTYCQ